MAARAREITAEALAKRLPIDNAQTNLATCGRFQPRRCHVCKMRLNASSLTADASHELRTPLTAMRSVGEVALRNTT